MTRKNEVRKYVKKKVGISFFQGFLGFTLLVQIKPKISPFIIRQLTCYFFNYKIMMSS